MLATEQTTPEFFLLAACHVSGLGGSLPETRVRGLPPGNHAGVSGCWPVTSTLVWGCGYSCDGTASVSLDQRFYASTYGRFNSPDPSWTSAKAGVPGTWNRYSYARLDPVNRNDPKGLDDDDDDDDDDDGGYGNGFVSSNPPPCSGNGGDCNCIGAIVVDPACIAVYGSALAVSWLASAPTSNPIPSQPLCPLVGIVGSYTVTSAWPVYAEFAPVMAYDIDEALSILNNEGVVPQINSGYRSVASQGNIPANNPNGVAPPGKSWHNVGLAVDFQLNPATQTGQEIIAAMEEVGLTWGGTWSSPDNVHFQLPPNVIHSNGTVTSGAPSPAQVAACQAEHPLGH